MKKLVVIAVALVMALSMCVSALAAGEQGNRLNAKLTVSSVNPGCVAAGGTFTVTFDIDAEGNYGGSAIATVSGAGFTLNSPVATYDCGTITENKKRNTLTVLCDPETKTGRYPVTLSVEYSKGDETVIRQQVLNIDVVGRTDPITPEDNGEVYLSVTSVPNGSVTAGESFNVGFTSNIGGIYSYNYGYGYGRGTVTVSGTGFSLAGSLAEQDINSGNSSVSVLADSSLDSGRYQMTLTVTYTVNGEKYSASKTLNIDVVGAKQQEDVDESKDAANFKLSSATIPEKIGRSELSTTLKLTFKNDSKFDAENVKVQLDNLDGLILNTFTNVADAGSVKAGESITASFPVKFPVDTKTQHILDASVAFDTAAGEKNQSFKVYLQAKEKPKDEGKIGDDSLTPKVIVKNYSVDVDNVTSGEEFTLSFTLENTSSEKDLYNMTVNITPKAPSSANGQSSGPVFSFIDGASSFYTPLLEKSSTKEYTIRLKCSASAGAGSYPIGISFDFQYKKGDSYTGDGSKGDLDINLPVVQPIKFELMEWTPPTECGPDGTSISFQYFNKSRNPMTSLSIAVEGDFTMPAQYVGTLAASSFDQFYGTITPNEDAKVGDTKTAILVFTFEDAAGNEGRLEYPFDVTVSESSDGDMMGGEMMGGDMPIMDDFMDPGMPVDGEGIDGEKAGLPTWAKIGIPAVVVIAAIIAAVVISKKVKAKRELEDDED